MMVKNMSRKGGCTHHPDRPILARGLCASCYNKQQYEKMSKSEKDKIKIRAKMWAYNNQRKRKEITARSNATGRIKEYKSIWYMLNRYGISLETYQGIAKKQNNRCAICGTDETTLQIDHCHDTGAIRGLLCGSCNRGIGLLGDKAEGAKRAYQYLSKAKQSKWVMPDFL